MYEENDREVVHRNRPPEGNNIRTDEELHNSDTTNLSEHNKQYTILLEAYVKDFVNNSENKRKNKLEMYKISKILLIIVLISTLIYLLITLFLLAFNKISIIESLPGLITVLTSLIGTFMVIPKMITKYLFNEKEEEHLAEIISKIQEYDRDIRRGA